MLHILMFTKTLVILQIYAYWIVTIVCFSLSLAWIVANNIWVKFELNVFLNTIFAKECLMSKVEEKKFGELNRTKTFNFLLLRWMSLGIINEVVFWLFFIFTLILNVGPFIVWFVEIINICPLSRNMACSNNCDGCSFDSQDIIICQSTCQCTWERWVLIFRLNNTWISKFPLCLT